MASPLDKFTLACVAVIGKANNPIYLKNFTSAPDLKQHYIVHTALDAVEEKVADNTKTDMYLGLLYSLEDTGVYGYITNTKIKFIAVVYNPYSPGLGSYIKEAAVRNIFSRISIAYISLVSNPFFDLDKAGPITSTRFVGTIENLSTLSYNPSSSVAGSTSESAASRPAVPVKDSASITVTV